MALVKCRECGTEISTEAAHCPSCGAGDPTGTLAAKKAADVSTNQKALGGCCLLFVAAAVIMGVALTSHTSSIPSGGEKSLASTSVPAPPPTRAARKAWILSSGSGLCKLSAARVESLLKNHPSWDDEAILTVACHKVRVGLTEDQLRASWGRPDEVNRTVVGASVDDQWVYGSNYVYVEGGEVTSYQVSH